MRRLMINLAHGEILDVGMEWYGEFICAPSYARELLAGGMTRVDGRQGWLSVIEEFENAVQLRWTFTGQPSRVASPLRRAA
jgi:hypothetical protein